MMMNEKIRIRLKAYDYRILDQSTSEIVDKAKRTAERKDKKTGRTSRRQVSDGYEAVQLGLVEDRKPRKVNKAMAGHFKTTGQDLPPVRVLREIRVGDKDEAKVGDKVSVEIF